MKSHIQGVFLQSLGFLQFIMVCRVLVSAVKQSSSGIKLVFFNNCFDDDYGKG